MVPSTEHVGVTSTKEVMNLCQLIAVIRTKSILLELDLLLLSLFRSSGSEASVAVLTVCLLPGLSVSCLKLSMINQRQLSFLFQESANPPVACNIKTRLRIHTGHSGPSILWLPSACLTPCLPHAPGSPLLHLLGI